MSENPIPEQLTPLISHSANKESKLGRRDQAKVTQWVRIHSWWWCLLGHGWAHEGGGRGGISGGQTRESSEKVAAYSESLHT